ncbi:MAG: 2-oxoacid:acceptor oxidoreductase family protein [Thermogutta sp.]
MLRATDIIAEAAFLAGYDVKKTEVHGMSQRGGSVISDVRFGNYVLSPMVPHGEADFLVVLEPTQEEPNRHYLKPEGTIIDCDCVDVGSLPNPRTLNVALLGVLSRHLNILDEIWHEAIGRCFPPHLHSVNVEAFKRGQQTAELAS